MAAMTPLSLKTEAAGKEHVPSGHIVALQLTRSFLFTGTYTFSQLIATSALLVLHSLSYSRFSYILSYILSNILFSLLAAFSAADSWLTFLSPLLCFGPQQCLGSLDSACPAPPPPVKAAHPANCRCCRKSLSVRAKQEGTFVSSVLFQLHRPVFTP